MVRIERGSTIAAAAGVADAPHTHQIEGTRYIRELNHITLMAKKKY